MGFLDFKLSSIYDVLEEYEEYEEYLEDKEYKKKIVKDSRVANSDGTDNYIFFHIGIGFLCSKYIEYRSK